MLLVAEIECFFYEPHSLKEKRAIIKKLLHRLQKERNVTVAEIDYQELWQRTKIAIATVSSDYVQAERIINQSFAIIDQFTELERTITNIDRY
nr:DUF503 family protein [Saliterribacillus persicus]